MEDIWTSEKFRLGFISVDDMLARIAELEGICGELYQVIGALAYHGGVFDHPDVQRALDVASEQKMLYDDLLPWPRTPLQKPERK